MSMNRAERRRLDREGSCIHCRTQNRWRASEYCLDCLTRIREAAWCPDCSSEVVLVMTFDDGKPPEPITVDVRHDETCPALRSIEDRGETRRIGELGDLLGDI